MIIHIVMWRLKDKAGGNDKASNAQLLKESLEGLKGKIPGLLHIEVGTDISRTEQSADVALYCEFDSEEALAYYQKHPAHKAVVPLVQTVTESRQVVDYSIDS